MSRPADEAAYRPKNAEILKDGHWYSLIRRSPRMHEHGQYSAASETFQWETPNEPKVLDLAEADEVLREVDGVFAGEVDQ